MNPFFAITRYIYILLSSLFLLIADNAFAQVPVINSFSPLNGPVGTVVTISGSNFAANPINNTVYFGATKANVIAATSTQLKVGAPIGSSNQPVTVTANGLTAYASSPFIITFGAPPFNANSFNGKIDITSGQGVFGTAVKDLDGDGKPDIVAVNSSAATISFLKNSSRPGSVSFINVIRAMGRYPIGVAIDDLDGDGKPDVVTTDFSNNTISVLKNTSANNTLNFNNALNFATATAPYNVTISDFNGDGKPDIAVTNEYSNPAVISVFTNTTTPGGPISFSAQINFPSQSNARGIIASDIDMDGKPDIIVASQNGFASVFRNTSTGTNISFAAEVDFAMPSGSSAESVVAGDLDGDLKPDLAVANNSGNNISILKNNSSPGNISFSPRQDFTGGKNPFSISMGDINGDGKPDIAVSNQVDNSVSVFINISTAGSINLNNKVDFNTGNYPRSSDVADIDGDGKPDVVTGNNFTNTESILLDNNQKSPSVITFPPPVTANIGSNNVLYPGATSTNNETPITYTSSNPAVAYVGADGLVHVIAPGVTDITASQTGNNDYLPATPVTEEFTIKEQQIIIFPAFTAKTTCSSDFNAGAVTSNTTLPLIYSSSNTAVATINADGLLHITGVGSAIITISQDGSNLFNPATPVMQTLTVTLPQSPVVSITASPTTACAGMSVVFTAAISNGTATGISYQWQVNGVNSGSNSSEFTVTTLTVTDVVQCVVTDNNSCFTPVTSNSITDISIIPYTTPAVVISSSAGNAVCSGTPVTFTIVVTNGGTNPAYQWEVNSLNTGNNQDTFTSTTLANGDKITCEITNNGGACLTMLTAASNTILAQITPATPPLSVTISASANDVYQGTIIQFTAIVSGSTGSVLNYQWQVNGINAGTNSAVFSSDLLKDHDEVDCIVTSGNLCAIPATSNVIKLTLIPLFNNIPNTFTPNGDGVNDVWNIEGLTNYPNCSVNIFNRWGILVYHATGYNKAWDGTYNGKALPVSAYYYIINLDAKTQPLKGYVTIIR